MFYIFGFYKFKRLSRLKKIRETFQKELIEANIRGTIIVSREGLNGSISGKNKNIQKIKKKLKIFVNLKNLIQKIFLVMLFNHIIEQK